jgi:hypothetical protein
LIVFIYFSGNQQIEFIMWYMSLRVAYARLVGQPDSGTLCGYSCPVVRVKAGHSWLPDVLARG